MRSLPCGISGLLFVLALAVTRSVAAQETRAVSGVVVDAESGAPVSDALVTIRGTGLSVVTDSEGRFEVSGVPVGRLELVLRHVAYGEHAQPLEVEASGSLDLRIRVTSRAIELAPLGVEVASRGTRDQRASGTATHVIDRATIEAAPRGQGLLPLLQGRIPSLRVEGSCVEYRDFRQVSIPDPASPEVRIVTPCRDITVYVDGVPDEQGSYLLGQLSPNDVERIEVVSGAGAGLQYMNASRGVILVETRRGVIRESRHRIHITGFGWDEPQSYPWLRVLGVSALANAAVAGLTSRTVFDCDGHEGSLTPVRCKAAMGTGVAFLTSAIGRAISHRVGRTPYSEGRTYPALLLGTATASIGYLLYVHGEKQDSHASRAGGQIVLAVGVPLTLTLSDRIFRMWR